MRNRLLLSWFFCCLLAATAFPQQSTAAPAQSGNVPQSTKSGDKSAGVPAGEATPKPANDYSKESFVIEQMHSRYRFEADGTGRKETIARIRVQSEAGVQQWGQLQEGYNSANERV